MERMQYGLRNCFSSRNGCLPQAESEVSNPQLILDLLCCSKLNSEQFSPYHVHYYVGLLALNLCLWEHKIHVIPVVRFYY